MPTDLQLLSQLEQQLGKPLQQVSFEQMVEDLKLYYKDRKFPNAYVVDEEDHIIALSLQNINVDVFPKVDLLQFKQLHLLSLANNPRLLYWEPQCFHQLLAGLAQLKNLQSLDLSYNQLQVLPTEIWCCQRKYHNSKI